MSNEKKDALHDLGEDELQLAVDELARRKAVEEKEILYGFTSRPKFTARCPGCKTPFTDDDIRRFDVCPVCGAEAVTPLD